MLERVEGQDSLVLRDSPEEQELQELLVVRVHLDQRVLMDNQVL